MSLFAFPPGFRVLIAGDIGSAIAGALLAVDGGFLAG